MSAVIFLVAAACGNGETNQSLATSTSSSIPATTTTESSTTTTTVAPPTPELLVIGDWGSGTEPQGAVAGAMSRFVDRRDVFAILTTGDNFYLDDTDFLMLPFEWAVSEAIEFWITWGNHDIETDDRIDAINTAFDSPPRWNLYEWGEVDVIVLDSNQIDSQEQQEFLIRVLRESQRPAIIAFHHPALSCSKYGDTPAVLTSWVPLFDDDVFVVLSGHDHNYQRFQLEDVTYLVTGGGGRRLYDIEECPTDHPPMIAGQSIHHFLVLTQSDEGLLITALDVNGEPMDTAVVPLP